MKVLVMADISSPHTLRWINALKERGLETWVLSLEQPDGPVENLVQIKTAFGSTKFRYILNLRPVKKAIDDIDPDLLNPHFAQNYGLLAALSAAGRPVFLSTWGSDLLVIPRKDMVRKAITRWILNKSDKILVDALLMRDALFKLSVPPHKITVMPLGVERDVRLREVRKPPEDPPLLLCTRRLEPDMDPLTILKAARLLHERGIAFRLLFTSRGKLEIELKDRAREWGIDESVDFTGWLSRDELIETISNAHYFLSASLTDSTSVSLLEAMALGAFPIVTDIPGNREWIVDGLNGYLFPPGDSGALADKIVMALENPELVERARTLNRKLIMERADWEKNMDGVVETMKALVRGR